MYLYCVTLTFETDQVATTHLAMSSDQEMQEYLDSQKEDFEATGVVGCSFFRVSFTDNGYRVFV